MAWDNVETHREITRSAIQRADSENELSGYLEQAFGIESLSQPRLPLVPGYHPEIDLDLGLGGTFGVSRLNCSFNSPDHPCDEDGIPEEDQVLPSASGCDAETPVDGCNRYSVNTLLRVGSYAEDTPTPRASNHFFEPVSGTGLDNQTLLLAGLDVLSADLVTTKYFGGRWYRFVVSVLTAPFLPLDLNSGNFDLDGEPAPDWALGTSAPPDNFIENRFSSADAERYLFRALSAPSRLEREHYLALHVLAVGHVAHLLEDMSNPAHTRNDFLIDHVWHREMDLEAAGREPDVVGFIRAAGAGGNSATRSLPGAFITAPERQQILAEKNPGGLPSYATTLPEFQTDVFDLRDFWGNQSGIAYFSHNHFFSGGTSSGQFDAPGRPGCPRDPNLPMGSPVPAPRDGVYLARLPGRELVSRFDAVEEPVDGAKTQFFYSSALVPHLANCRYHALPRKQVQVTGSDFHWGATVIDESVQRDYLEILLPLTVDYTAQFLRHYFQMRLELVPLGEHRFKLRNLTRLPFEARTDAVQVAFDTRGGSRRTLPVSCSGQMISLAANLDGDSDSTSDAICLLPAVGATEDPNALPADPGEFWAVVRGSLGARGDSSEPLPQNWKEGDYVTAFARSRNEVLYSAAAPPFGAIGMSPQEWDSIERHDLYRSPVDLDGVDPNAPVTAYENVTAHLRASDPDDFRRAAVSPTSSRVALMSDVGVAPADQHYLASPHPEDPNVLILGAPNGLVARAGILDVTESDPNLALRPLGANEDDIGSLPVWLLGTNSFFARRTNPANPADDLALYDTETGAEQPHPILDDFPVTGGVVSLLEAAGENPARGCSVSGDDLLAAKQEAENAVLYAVRATCWQTVPAEGGGQTFGAAPNTHQVVLLDSNGQPLEAVMIDADEAAQATARPCTGGCDFDGFTAPVVEHASFSPTTKKLAIVVGKRGEFVARGHRMYVYDYGTKVVTPIPEPMECVQGWLTWLPAGDRIAYLANGHAPCSPTTQGAQLHVIGADGSPDSLRIATKFNDGLRRANPTWWSPLRIPVTAPASGP